MSILCVQSHALLDRAVSECKSGVFIDAGANIGGMITLASDMEVHAFEPVPDVFDKLESSYVNRPNTYLNRLGLSDRKEVLHQVTVTNCWTLGDPDRVGLDVAMDYVGKRFDVDLITLDSYVQQRGITIGVLKLDVDGYEHKALRGAEVSILRDRPFIYTEVSYLIRNISGRIEDFVDYTIDRLGYTWLSNDGSFRTVDRQLILNEYPWHSSYDVSLVPTEFVTSRFP